MINTVSINHTNLEVATKTLKVQQTKDGRKIVVSTNLLPLFGFEKGEKVTEETIGKGKGIIIKCVGDKNTNLKTKKIYSRTYKSRRNNPIEIMLDVRSQKLINESLGDALEVQIIFKQGEVQILPIKDANDALSKIKDNPYGLMAVCTSGIDLHASESVGFECQSILEYRPQEKRDKTNLTETGLVNCLVNSNGSLQAVYNEDIYKVNPRLVSKTLKHRPTVLTISLQCDDFSNLKSKSLKDKSLDELSTTKDMFIPALALIKALTPPVIVLENVPNFLGSSEEGLWTLQLRRMGYKITNFILNGEDFGYTKRKRFFQVASLLREDFKIPTKISDKDDLWKDIVYPLLKKKALRNVSSSKSIQDGHTIGRLRKIKKDSYSAPTLLKSQSRMAKDSVVVEHKGEFFFPNEDLERMLMSYPNSLDLSGVTQTIASEIIGQGVEYVLFQKIMKKIKLMIQKQLKS